MSWHKPSRTTLIHQAVLVSLLGTTSLAHAVTLGQANIKSAQHEPLSATIDVSDIDAKNFNASLATADIYQQMGLSAADKITVRFTPTSDTTGQITLTSSTPISSPFADVVLNLNDNGKQVIEPQTLLMPLPSGGSFNLPDNSTMVASDSWQNLPVTSDDLPDEDAINASVTPSVPTLPPVSTTKTNSKQANADTQTQILTEQVTRRAYPAGTVTAADLLPPPNNEETPVTAQAQDETPKAEQRASSGAVYVVQSGDSLWSIANHIASVNNMPVQDVMKELHSANPDAFNHGKMNRLKAKASLSLPDYQVIPSQKAIEDAISAKRKHSSGHTVAKAHTTKSKKSTTHSKPSTTSSNVKAQARPKASNTKAAKPARALPKAQVTLVTPTQQGAAAGTNSKPVPSAKAGGNGDLVGTLKNTRQQTASSAKRVNGLNQELSTATAKLQLQNQKLAELEARLRALKSAP